MQTWVHLKTDEGVEAPLAEHDFDHEAGYGWIPTRSESYVPIETKKQCPMCRTSNVSARFGGRE